ncbi:MAG: LLM class flavin-dependent oxidoreductase [Candidatus Eremiobacteraeota bacterium]|nr:LLM class flavin-dependent oxidoreductase [Candidatus Eremiobacteraeota bacterium]
MKIATGLPTAIPNTSGTVFMEWARRAEQAEFSSLGTIGRTVFDSHEELIALAGAAAVTERIGLMTTVLLGPPRDPVLLAKQAATLDSLSGGRFSLGLGIGWRQDEFVAHGCPKRFGRRGDYLEEQIKVFRQIWSGQNFEGFNYPVGPKASPTLILSGRAEAAVRRAGRLADGFIAAPANLEDTRLQFEWVREEWQKAGRSGSPRLYASRYFAIGQTELANQNMATYYEAAGPDFIKMMHGWVMRDADQVRRAVDDMREAGAEELFFWPSLNDPSQVERLKEVL